MLSGGQSAPRAHFGEYARIPSTFRPRALAPSTTLSSGPQRYLLFWYSIDAQSMSTASHFAPDSCDRVQVGLAFLLALPEQHVAGAQPDVVAGDRIGRSHAGQRCEQAHQQQHPAARTLIGYVRRRTNAPRAPPVSSDRPDVRSAALRDSARHQPNRTDTEGHRGPNPSGPNRRRGCNTRRAHVDSARPRAAHVTASSPLVGAHTVQSGTDGRSTRSELDLDVARRRRTRVRRVLVLREQDTPALHRDLEVAHAALRAVEAALRAPELVLGVVQVGAQQLELRPVALVELRRHPRHLPPCVPAPSAAVTPPRLPVRRCTETVRAAFATVRTAGDDGGR